MNPQTVAAFRILVMLAGGFLVGKGWVSKETLDTLTDPTTVAAIGGGLAAIAAAASAIYSRRAAGMIKATAALPEVAAVIATPATATAIPAVNVVGSVAEAAALSGVKP